MKFLKMKHAIALMGVAVVAQTAWAQNADERAIRAVGDEWQRALNAHDVDRVMAIHTPEAIYMLSHQPLITGSSAIRAGWSEALKIPNYTVHWTPTKIDVASPRVATEYGTYTESYTGPDGKTVNDGGNYITIWHKVNGKWLVAIDAPNTTSPLPAPTAQSALSDADRVAVEAAVRGVTQELIDAGAHVDPERLLSYFSRSPGFAVADNGALMTSREQFHDALVGFYKGLRSQDANFGETRIVALAPDKAIETMTGTVVRVDKSGVRSTPQTFSWTLLWVREPEGWKILQGHESFLPPAR